MHYTKVPESVLYWEWFGDGFYPTYSSLLPVEYNNGNGVPEIANSVLEALNIIPKTDQVQTDQLINANWGMFNFLRDFLNWGFGAILDALGVILSPLQGILQAAFVPSESYLDSFVADMQEMLDVKLGFLWTAFDWIIDTLNSMTSVSAVGSMTFGNLFGSPMTINMQPMVDGTSTWFNWLRLMIQAVTSWQLISALYDRFMDKLKGV